MKTIKRYSIQNENGTKMATFLSKNTAQEWLELANTGVLNKRSGWNGETYSMVMYEAEITNNNGTQVFK